MQWEQTKNVKILQISCRDSDRHLPPQRAAIDAMKKSMTAVGQITPISVYPITHNTYRIITGATRFRAASELNWQTILASVWSGSVIDFQLHELVENVERRELTREQRREMRMKIKELERAKLANIEAGKGGRGNKGGVREEARQMSIPETTARRRKDGIKLRQNDVYGAVSDPATTLTKPMPTQPKQKNTASTRMTPDELDRLDTWSSKHNMTRADAMRRIIRERLAADEAAERIASGNVIAAKFSSTK